MKQIYLVTGAAGHLGGVVVQNLIERGKCVRALVLPNEKNIPELAEIYKGDVCDKSSIKACFDNLGDSKLVVIHCAGIVSISSKFDQAVFDVNVRGTKNVVDLCREDKVHKLIYVSSVHAIREQPKGVTIKETTDFSPDNVVGLYAKTKAEATACVLEAASKGLNACVVHPSGIAGPYDNGRGHITTLIIDYYKHRLVSGIYGGYDFVDVRDVANGIIAACDKGKSGECYILSNRYFKISEILDMLHEITGKKKIKRYLPYWFVKMTASLSEIYYKMLKQPPLFTSYSLYTLNSNSLFSHQKATIELGYKTRDMNVTLAETVKWLKESGRI
ncbi:NAD-dependent epimerase/dehydratase family protein [Peptostreptococcus faecalis]|uniref:NAD-dependent epimerase/dehydratase family protein n=1 Tax=Peptostreptococcus faecalis TaxID=2045015 RepID=UPI000C7B2D2C|nr:NAD-dependent epimerase/dehydratase family protein [Peptostreptococcus faecalis]